MGLIGYLTVGNPIFGVDQHFFLFHLAGGVGVDAVLEEMGKWKKIVEYRDTVS